MSTPFPRSSRRAAARAFLVLAMVVGASSLSAESVGRATQGGRLVGLIGNWSWVTDGGPALRMDGESWSGTTDRAQLERAVRPLFANLGDTFLAHGTSDAAFPLAAHADVPSFTGGTVRVQFKLLGGRTDQNAGIVVGLRPSGEYVFVRYNTKDGNVAVWEYVGGERRVIARGERTAQLPMGQWNSLVVTVSGRTVTGVVNDSLRVEHTLAQPLDGRVGLWTKRDAVTLFRGFTVER